MSRVRGICTLEDCNLPHRGRGYCQHHYNNLRNNGDPRLIKAKRGGYKHGMANTPTWQSWRGMVERVSNPKYKQAKDYLERGITAEGRWLEKKGFLNFLEDMGERPEGTTLDRIDNDKGYSKENCRWATYVEQNNNRRQRSKNV